MTIDEGEEPWHVLLRIRPEQVVPDLGLDPISAAASRSRIRAALTARVGDPELDAEPVLAAIGGTAQGVLSASPPWTRLSRSSAGSRPHHTRLN
ncbi:hypothetical protein [Rhodococcus phenolicus]|uniref:hypothetical protein n=1 Tax=Rhodococcus phenolicus TaxID=263849 RepID=UPI00082C2988|nr:hypothetical protein [Rhodococcus phenolicus]